MTTGSRQTTLHDGTTIWKSWTGADRPPGSTSLEFHPYEMYGGVNRFHKSIFKATESPYTCEQLVWMFSPGVNKTFGANVLPVDSDWNSDDEGKLLEKLTRLIKGTEFHAGVFLATLPVAVQQTLSTLQAFNGAIRSLRKGDLTGALISIGMSAGQRKRKFMQKKLNQGDISGTWLAMQYGWIPTLHDLFSLWQLVVEESTSEEPRKLRFKVKSGRSFTYEGSTAPNEASCPGNASLSTVLIYDLEAELSWYTKLGLIDPLSVLWEVTPFSFVADWFVPIGSYLEQLSIMPRLSGTWCRSLRRNFEATEGIIYDGSVCAGIQRAYFRSTSLTRATGSTALPVPTPKFKPLNKALSSGHIKNGIALLHQLSGYTKK